MDPTELLPAYLAASCDPNEQVHAVHALHALHAGRRRRMLASPPGASPPSQPPRTSHRRIPCKMKPLGRAAPLPASPPRPGVPPGRGVAEEAVRRRLAAPPRHAPRPRCLTASLPNCLPPEASAQHAPRCSLNTSPPSPPLLPPPSPRPCSNPAPPLLPPAPRSRSRGCSRHRTAVRPLPRHPGGRVAAGGGAARPCWRRPARPPAGALLQEPGRSQLLPPLPHGGRELGLLCRPAGLPSGVPGGAWAGGTACRAAGSVNTRHIPTAPSPLSPSPDSRPPPPQTVVLCLYGGQSAPRLRLAGMEFAVWMLKHAGGAQLAPAAGPILDSCLGLLVEGGWVGGFANVPGTRIGFADRFNGTAGKERTEERARRPRRCISCD